MTARRILGPVVAAIVVAATGLLALPVSAPAHAASACSGRTGVIVVVDFNQLGGGVTKGCDPASGHNAQQNFESAGYHLGMVPGQPGMVCRVSGKPADPPCADTDAYWSLWWSNGTSGKWTYATSGVGGLKVPTGGYVAFAWHQGSGNAGAPGVQATPRVASTPTKQPSPQPTGHPGGHPSHHPTSHPTHAQGGGHASPGQPSASATGATTAGTPSASAGSPGATPGKHHRGKRDRVDKVESPDAQPSATSSSTLPSIDEVTAGPPADTSKHDGWSWATWLAIAVGVVVIGAAAAVPLLRRRRSG